MVGFGRYTSSSSFDIKLFRKLSRCIVGEVILSIGQFLLLLYHISAVVMHSCIGSSDVAARAAVTILPGSQDLERRASQLSVHWTLPLLTASLW